MTPLFKYDSDGNTLSGSYIDSPGQSRVHRTNSPNNANGHRQAQREPDVEYLEDSRLSVDFFRMKGSVFFSAVYKEDLEQEASMGEKNSEKQPSGKEDQAKFFNISSSPQGDQCMLNSIMVGPLHQPDGPEQWEETTQKRPFKKAL